MSNAPPHHRGPNYQNMFDELSLATEDFFSEKLLCNYFASSLTFKSDFGDFFFLSFLLCQNSKLHALTEFELRVFFGHVSCGERKSSAQLGSPLEVSFNIPHYHFYATLGRLNKSLIGVKTKLFRLLLAPVRPFNRT